MRLSVIIITILLAMCTIAETTPPKRLGVISKPQYYMGCECELYLNKEKTKPVYISHIDGKEAWFNIDGKDEKLSMTETTEGNDMRLGYKFLRTYRYGKTLITVKFKVVDACNGREECDGWGLEGIISIPSGNGVEQLPAKGLCGC
ncbi:MAG: hypothetical protein CVU55_11995 [Deltaproteobacteria bacterium HGW-Deltaproteobacteria-13]|jgi:hypothetical protein|nr:MAG: hypothetical protein CVU55_11995 [Deltaproteobacteria bacterium HGW-Deltaproteobacteria-13]